MPSDEQVHPEHHSIQRRVLSGRLRGSDPAHQRWHLRVQAGHNPVLVALHMGMLHFVVDGKARDVLVGDGIAEVTPAYVMVLVDSAENPEDIDKNRAEAARIRAEERLQHKQSMHEYYQSKIALDRAMQRLQTAAKYKR